MDLTFKLPGARYEYGESHPFVRLLDKLQYPWIMAIRSNHGVLMPQEQLGANQPLEGFQLDFL